MKWRVPDRTEDFGLLPVLVAAFAVCLGSTLSFAAAPSWWSDRGVLNPNSEANDYAAVNHGQLKNIAVAALAELNAHLPNGAGIVLDQLGVTLTGTSASTNDYAAVNLGQLKNLAKPFYDRLREVGYASVYPWDNSTNPPNDYAMANIGQVKNLFSFDMTDFNWTDETLPDWWKQNFFGTEEVDPDADPDGDGLTNLQEYHAGTPPNEAPVITITSPTNGATSNLNRIDIRGTVTSRFLIQSLFVKGVFGFVAGNTFQARAVPLQTGSNVISAQLTDIYGQTASASIAVVAELNAGQTELLEAVTLAATPQTGFSPLVVTFQPTTNAPGSLQQVTYDFDGDGVVDLTQTTLQSVTHTYSMAGDYFPVVTVRTSSGSFSSAGGFHAEQGLRIHVQTPPQQQSVINVIDPIDLKVAKDGSLYVLSRSTSTITQFNGSGTVQRSKASLGSSPSGLDVDSQGNVYVAQTGDNQVVKLKPSGSTFVADTSSG